MRVWTSTEKVWWFTNSEDKPSNEFFTNFKNNMIENDEIRVQFKNYDNVTVISKTDDLTYVKIEHNGKTYYYYVNDVLRITNNGYELNLLLDVFTTFTLPFITTLELENKQVKTIRNLIDSDSRLFFTDELLEQVPKSYKNVEFVKKQFLNENGYYYKNKNLQIKKDDNTINPVVYARFKNMKMKNVGDTSPFAPGDVTNVFVPVLSFNNTSGYITVKWDGDNPYHPELQDYSTENTYGNIYTLSQGFYAGEFDGFYLLPNVLNFHEYASVKWVQYGTGGRDEPVYQTLLVLDLQYQYQRHIEEILLPSIPMLPLTPNSIFLCDKQVTKYMDIKYYDNVLKTEFWGETYTNEYSFNLRDLLFTFAGQGQLNMKVKNLPLENTQLTLPYQLPSISNTYQAYVNSTYNTVNTSYQIAKQNQVVDILRSGIGWGLNTAVAPQYALNTTSNLIGGIGNSFLTLSQKRRTIQAQYMDAKRRLLPELNVSNISDNKFIRYLVDKDFYEGVEVSHLSGETLSQLNNILYYYGYFNPQMNNMRYILSLKRDNAFTYFSLDTDYTLDLIGKYSNAFIKYYTDIVNELSGGVRLWDKTPDYN